MMCPLYQQWHSCGSRKGRMQVVLSSVAGEYAAGNSRFQYHICFLTCCPSRAVNSIQSQSSERLSTRDCPRCLSDQAEGVRANIQVQVRLPTILSDKA